MEKIRAGLYGLCVADALGVPSESRTREDLRRKPITEMVGGGLHQQPAGYWSDDSSMTLCLADSIGKVGYYHTHDIMARFDDWARNGAYTSGGKKFDIGNTCAHAISRYRRGVTPALCGSNKMNENGNGSLMRILPMAFVLYGKYGIKITESKRAMEDIHKISGLTHRHPLAQSACGIYLAIAVRILDGYELRKAIREGVKVALEWYGSHHRFWDCVDTWERISDPERFHWETEETIYSGGYVVETLETVLWCLMNTTSYRECVLRCVNMGYDADSTAAIAGGLAGIYYGFDNIPQDWIDQLAAKEIIDDCIAGLERYCLENNTYKFKTYWNYNWIRFSKCENLRTPLDTKPMKRNLDKFRGCLIGGAAGDALGYAVEFLSESFIRSRFGDKGITEYQLRNGLARISDDTQMTLFTANGLLFGVTRGHMRGIMGSPDSYIAVAYREWYKTQIESYAHCNREFTTCWLLNVPELFAERAPGNTCMSAIDAGCHGSIEKPINDSKGCGGVMRVAPVGLYYGESHWDGMRVDLLAADIAARTHGHEMGYIPAAMLAHIVRLVSHNDEITLKEAVLDSYTAMKRIFPYAKHLPAFLRLIDKAVELSESGVDDLTAIHALGPGWCGDEALAVAIYCALKYDHDFDKALIAAVNHGGDSDSTGAITGNILGAYLGLSAIPEKYTKKLELLDVITEIADDLYYGCNINEYTRSTDPRDWAWEEKYVDITYPGKKHD